MRMMFKITINGQEKCMMTIRTVLQNKNDICVTFTFGYDVFSWF